MHRSRSTDCPTNYYHHQHGGYGWVHNDDHGDNEDVDIDDEDGGNDNYDFDKFDDDYDDRNDCDKGTIIIILVK